MKKIFVIFTIIASVSAVTFYGCKKNMQQEQTIAGAPDVSASTSGISVNSQYGFLVFETVDDYRCVYGFFISKYA